MMKWRKETRSYMWAKYFSEDGKWVAWDEEILVTSSKRKYNPVTKKFEQMQSYNHYWLLKNLLTGETLTEHFKTLTAAKKFAEMA